MSMLILLLFPFLLAPVPVIVGGHLAVAAAYGVGCVELESEAAPCRVLDVNIEDGAAR